MYRVFCYRVDDDGSGLYIEDEFEYNTFEEALKKVVFFEDDDLFEITKDVPSIDGDYLRTIARPASMRAYVNTYYLRW